MASRAKKSEEKPVPVKITRTDHFLVFDGLLSRYAYEYQSATDTGRQLIDAARKVLEESGVHDKEIYDARRLVELYTKDARENEARVARIMAAAAAAFGDTRTDEQRAVALRRFKSLVANAGSFAPARHVHAAHEHLLKLCQDSSWRTIDVIDGGRMTQLVVWNGGGERHPRTLAEFILLWITGETPVSHGPMGMVDLSDEEGDEEL